MPFKHRQTLGWVLLVMIMGITAYVIIKKGYISEIPTYMIFLTLAIGILSIAGIRFYLVTVGETALKHYSLARRYHKKYEKFFKKGDLKLAEKHRKAANKHRERAWKLEEKQGF